MYWIYLAIFVLVILTPKIIQEGWVFFQEEDIEALLIFGFGLFGFLLYLAKEKALLRVFQEKLRLQKQTNIISRDLSDSYSYIGEMNRKFDIVKEFIFNLPKSTADALVQGAPHVYTPVIEATKLLAKTDHVSLRFVNIREKKLEKTFEIHPKESFSKFTAALLLESKKFFWEEEDVAIIRSPRQASGITAFLIFPKSTNRIEDVEVFKILVSEALFLYCIERGISLRENK